MPQRVIIIGGGISGLATAHRLCESVRKEKSDLHITLLEGRERLGGIIETERREGFLMEAGPDSFISEKPWAYELCKRLGIKEEVIGRWARSRSGLLVK